MEDGRGLRLAPIRVHVRIGGGRKAAPPSTAKKGEGERRSTPTPLVLWSGAVSPSYFGSCCFLSSSLAAPLRVVLPSPAWKGERALPSASWPLPAVMLALCGLSSGKACPFGPILGPLRPRASGVSGVWQVLFWQFASKSNTQEDHKFNNLFLHATEVSSGLLSTRGRGAK